MFIWELMSEITICCAAHTDCADHMHGPAEDRSKMLCSVTDRLSDRTPPPADRDRTTPPATTDAWTSFTVTSEAVTAAMTSMSHLGVGGGGGSVVKSTR